MKPALLPLLGLLCLASSGCVDIQRNAYQPAGATNKHSRQTIMATPYLRDIPPPRCYSSRWSANTASQPAGSPYAGNFPARVTGEVVVPPTSPGLYGPVSDLQVNAASYASTGFGGPSYRYALRGYGYYGGDYGYYPGIYGPYAYGTNCVTGGVRGVGVVGRVGNAGTGFVRTR